MFVQTISSKIKIPSKLVFMDMGMNSNVSALFSHGRPLYAYITKTIHNPIFYELCTKLCMTYLIAAAIKIYDKGIASVEHVFPRGGRNGLWNILYASH